MRRFLRTTTAGVALALGLHAGVAVAQQTTEDKLREALRKQTVDYRALQDSVATLQSAKDAAEKAVAEYAEALKARDARINELQATAGTKPAAQPADEEQVHKLQAALAAAARDNAALQAGLAKTQSAYQQTASVAQAKDAETRSLATTLKAAQQAADYGRQQNEKLTALANDILHLYRTQSFRNLLFGSYEPLLGLKKVELENLVQDYEDKIDALHYSGTERGPATTASAPAAGATK